MSQQNDQQEENIVQKQSKKLLRDKAIKLGKRVGKVAVKAAMNGALAIGKTLMGILAGIGGPYLLLIGVIIATLVIIFVSVSLIFGGDPDSLDKDERAILEAFREVSDSTVDMSKPEQIPYKVPLDLIIAVMQIQDSGNVNTIKSAQQFGEALRPIFQYETREGITETTTTVCNLVEREDETVEEVCNTTNSVHKFEVTLLVSVEAWDRRMAAEIKHEKTPWETRTSTRSGGGSVTSTSRSDFFWTEEVVTMDYTLFNRELSEKPFDYGYESKLLVEALYQIMGGEIYYKEWLTDNSLIGFDGTVIPGSGVPQEYMQYYLEAEKKYGVDWYYLAALHFIETAFSTHGTMISSVGAEGHMQFMPCTWLGWNYPECGGLGFVDISDAIKHSPSNISKYGGYGVDADGDGKADPWNVKDAIFAAANYMNKSGFSKDIDGAIFNYNRSLTYVENVKNKANEFKQMAQYLPESGSVPNLVPGSFMRPALGRISSGYGPRKLTGRFHYGVDIASAKNTPIVAVADGVVTKVHSGCPETGYLGSKCGGEWGNHVRIHHKVQGRIYEAVYAHFTKPAVSVGQNVSQGQLIGYMGMSGSSTGVHLHFELSNGVRNRYTNILNPSHYIPF